MATSARPVLDAMYRSVTDQRRRTVLSYLRDIEGETASLDELVEHVVDEETNSPDRESVRVDLYHCQLPLLADTGVVEFDSRSETVRYRSSPVIESVLTDTVGSETAPVTQKER